MTKTLTEQMKTEHGAWYYVRTKEGVVCHWLLFSDTLDIEKDIVEVLAPVPSYDKVKEMSQKIERLEFDNEALEMAHNELEKKLEIATKALEFYSDLSTAGAEARQALKEMEGVK